MSSKPVPTLSLSFPNIDLLTARGRIGVNEEETIGEQKMWNSCAEGIPPNSVQENSKTINKRKEVGDTKNGE